MFGLMIIATLWIPLVMFLMYISKNKIRIKGYTSENDVIGKEIEFEEIDKGEYEFVSVTYKWEDNNEYIYFSKTEDLDINKIKNCKGKHDWLKYASITTINSYKNITKEFRKYSCPSRDFNNVEMNFQWIFGKEGVMEIRDYYDNIIKIDLVNNTIHSNNYMRKLLSYIPKLIINENNDTVSKEIVEFSMIEEEVNDDNIKDWGIV